MSTTDHTSDERFDAIRALIQSVYESWEQKEYEMIESKIRERNRSLEMIVTQATAETSDAIRSLIEDAKQQDLRIASLANKNKESIRETLIEGKRTEKKINAYKLD